jgi:hypothetical protein
VTVAYRTATAEDRDFIVSSWSASFKNAYAAGIIQADDWADIMHSQIRKLLDRPGTRAIVAYEKKSPGFIYGFIAGDTTDAEKPVVHFVYTKAPYRMTGHARGLFAALGVDPSKPFQYVCKTAVVSKLAHKIRLAKWNPLVARYPKGAPQQ